jgi:predicted metal-dependent hydrolase
MKEITQFARHTVEIWRRPRQKHMHLRVRADGTLRVTCHKRVAKREIFAFLAESEPFIEKGLADLRAKREKFPPKKFVSDEPYLFLGERRPLQIVWSWNERILVKAFADRLEMVAPLSSTPIERQTALHKFLRRQAREILKHRLELYSRQMGLTPASLTVRGQRTRWGSCSSQGNINLNWKLMCAPPDVIDYVVIHELAHLEHMNHSPKFWDLVGAHFPEHKWAKKWLRAHEDEIAVQFQIP